jgi:hypothetical protein
MMSDEQFYCPTPVDQWRSFLKQGLSTLDWSASHGQLSNIAYNLQYLEFLDHQVHHNYLHASVGTITHKMMVVTGMSIVESILFGILSKLDLVGVNEWAPIQEDMGRTQAVEGVLFRIRTITDRKLEVPIPKSLTLDQMVKKVEKRKLIGLDQQSFADLSRLRKLRNKIHIHDVSSRQHTDWNSFGLKESNLIKSVLYALLTSSIFSPDENQLKLCQFLTYQPKTWTLKS